MSEKKRVKHYVSKKTGKVFPAEEWTVGEPVDGKRSIPLDRFPLDIIYHDEKKREPLLSDDAMGAMRGEYAYLFSGHKHDKEAWTIGALEVRKHYERLIDEGTLRVVVEIEVEWPGSGVTSCPVQGCGKTIISPEDNFCPGCGGKIKR